MKREPIDWLIRACLPLALAVMPVGAMAATAPQEDATVPERPARMIARNQLGAEHCLVRTIPADGGGTRIVKMPVIGVSNRDHWHNNQTILLDPVPHAGYCPELVTLLEDDELHIAKHGNEEYRVRLVRRQPRILLDAIFRRPNDGGDDYLVAQAENCEGNCGEFGDHDAFLYMADEPRPAGNAKLVFIEFFPSEGGSEQCQAERPERAMKPRGNEPCELAWPPGAFPLHESPDKDKQLGTGGGYEPPG